MNTTPTSAFLTAPDSQPSRPSRIGRFTRLAATFGFVALVASACSLTVSFGDGIIGSGDLVTETYDFDDFDEIEVGSAFDATVTVGERHAIEITVDDNLVEHLEVTVRGDKLVIHLDESLERGTLEAAVTVPKLVALEANGATNVDVTGLNADDFDLEVNGASDVTIAGSATSLQLDVNGASDAKLDRLDVVNVTIDANGASDVRLRGAINVDGDLNGASDLWVSGDAQVSVSTTGASTTYRG